MEHEPNRPQYRYHRRSSTAASWRGRYPRSGYAGSVAMSHPGSDGGPDTRMIFLVEGRTLNGCPEEVSAGVAGPSDPVGEGVGPAVDPHRQGSGRASGSVAQLGASG